MTPFTQNWTDNTGNHDGGVSCGIGFTISWQRGPLGEAGRNGAFMLEVLNACKQQLEYYQSSKFACDENQQAIGGVQAAIDALESRKQNRADAGKLGTHEV